MQTRKSNRLKNYDYSQEGMYFVTICSNERENIFCQYNQSVGAALVSARYEIQLTKIGQIIKNQWNNMPQHYHKLFDHLNPDARLNI